MKNRLGFAIVVLLFGAATLQVPAQEIRINFEPVKFQKILDKAFVPALESNIPGIVEGSIYNIIVCKKYCSTLDFTETTEKLRWLITENKSSSISYKAHLALMYIVDADNINITPKSLPETHDYLFRQLAKELETKMLVSNDALTEK